jgi:putative endopeptidase
MLPETLATASAVVSVAEARGSRLLTVMRIVVLLLLSLECAIAFSQQRHGATASHIDPSVMDLGADPCQDFYRYACGNYVANHPLQAGKDYVFLTDLQRRDAVADLADYLAHHDGIAEGDKQLQALHTYFATCVAGDSATTAMTALKPLLSAINHYQRPTQLPALLAEFDQAGVAPFFRVVVGSEPDVSGLRILEFFPPRLSLSSATSYSGQTDQQKVSLKQLHDHIQRVLVILGEKTSDAATDATAVVEVEHSLARAARTPIQERDPRLHINARTVKALTRELPGFEWSTFLSSLGIHQDVGLNIDSPEELAAFVATINSQPPSAVRAYLRYQLVTSVPLVVQPAELAAEMHAYSNRGAVDTASSRNDSCLLLTARARQDDLIRLYVREFLPPSLKADAEALVAQIKQQFSAELRSASWLDPSTRQKAAEKLSQLAQIIAYDNLTHSYDKASVSEHNALRNYFVATRFNLQRSIATLGTRDDRNESRLLAIATGAVFEGSANFIEIPAVEWTPPSFDPHASSAENFGRVGFTVGHELVHGFDDKGRQRDGLGRLTDWWTAADTERFKEKAQCFVREYQQFGTDHEHHENGQLTLGENIADNGGLHIAMLAFLADAKEHGVDVEDGHDQWSPFQRFFLSYAQETCSAVRPESELLQMETNPHSLDRFRANGVVRNVPEFARAFSCHPSAPMAPVDRCAIW